MLSLIVQFSLAQRMFVLIATGLLVGTGWYAFEHLPIDAFPDVSSTQVKIIIKSPGMTPEEVESRIATPIEVEMLGIPHQQMLRSTSKYGLVDVTVDFEDGTDVFWARQQVAERLGAIAGDLPENITGGMAPITTPLGEMFMFTVESESLTLAERRSLLDWVIRPALRSVPGVADVNSLGGVVRTYEIVPDAVKMAAVGVSLNQLQTAIGANNRNSGGGRLGEGDEVLLVRSEGSVQSMADLRDIVIDRRQNVPVRVSDVAQVQTGELTRYGCVTQDGEGEAVEGLVLGLAGANAREVVAGVRSKLEELQGSLPEGTAIQIFYDRSELVDKAVGTVSEALIEATLLVLVLLGAFLGNLRAAITVAVVLPLAALSTFILMRAVGMSANLMSLGGLAIAIGMLVDAAVVVVENVVRHLSRDATGGKLPRLHIVYRAVREVAAPVTSGILIIITVFLPLVTLEGLEGKLFVPVALTIAFALGCSLLLSLMVIPVLASLLIQRPSDEEPWLPRKLLALYRPSLRWALARQRVVFAATGALLVLAAIVYGRVGKIFIPEMDEGNVVIQIEKLPSVSLQESADVDLRIQRVLLAELPEISGVVARTGSDEIGLDPMGLNETDTFFKFKPTEEWRAGGKEVLIGRMREVLDRFPGLAYNITQPIDMRVSEMIVGVRGAVAIKVFGPDLATLNELAAKIETLVKTIEGNEDVYTVQNAGVQYMRVVVNRLAAGRFGLSVEDVEETLHTQIEGQRAGIVMEGGYRVPIVLRGPSRVQLSPAEFAGLRITSSEGISVPLAVVAKLERSSGPVKIAREMGSRFSVVVANVTGRDLIGFVDEAKALIAAQLQLPIGYRITWGGQFENQQRAAARLMLVIPFALGLIFVILFSTFGSVRQALLVLSNIPCALVGGILLLWVSGEYLSVPAAIGFIALLGIAVLNGVVLVSCFNQLRTEGHDLRSCVVHGAERRLRPVMMTASITAFGLIPLLFASGPGSEIQRPLAIVVIGGLLSATALTLLVLPILYLRFADAPARRRLEIRHAA